VKRVRTCGFTLIEVLIALFILSFVLLGMSSMVLSVMRATGQTREMTTADTLLQEEMEVLKNTPYNALVSSAADQSISRGNITYSRHWVVNTTGNIKTVTVTVDWTDRVARTISMTTYRAE
jgi:type IV pilus assembly protein PilV